MDAVVFPDVYKWHHSGVYGNETKLLCKIGRLLVVHDAHEEITCHVILSPELKIDVYHVQLFIDDCLAGKKNCTETFGVTTDTQSLEDEPGVLFQTSVVGSLNIQFTEPLIDIKESVEFYRILRQESDIVAKHGVFFNLVDFRRTSTTVRNGVRVFLHEGTLESQEKLKHATYDLIMNVKTTSSMLTRIAPYWWVFYDATHSNIGSNPLLNRLCLPRLRPLV